MKKLLMISAMLLVGALSVSAQTYYYKYLYTVDKQSGVKKNPGNGSSGKYFTFSNNKANCYESEKDGTLYAPKYYGGYNPTTNSIIDRIAVYNYTKTLNGMHIYQQTKVETGGYNFIPKHTWGGTGTYTFSGDFSRLNIGGAGNNVEVYERSTPQEEQNTPTQLY